ncbi:hypothetical protein GNP89_19305 [Aliivibrio fischeri]|uniref:hypothetical protein n=1 Tax=Aliivibrio fischeri TaxID=668 RepID=UPI0012D980C7|nr:hypothetical protein [Aliivibrio fischeri]MUL04314.1 hypothetical protein [Aliivibrio fischeri]
MSATQFVLDHIISVLGGAGVVVTSLSAYLGKLLADRSLMREKASLTRDLQSQKDKHSLEIKLLERELQLELSKKDQFHQISKSTYENLFNRKISVYSDLLKLKTDYDKFVNESGSFEYIDPTTDFLSHFNLFKAKIEDNRLYISNELSTVFDDWYKEAAPYFQRIEEEEVSYYASSSMHEGRDVDPQLIWERQEPIIRELVSQTIFKMTDVIKQIDKDVSEIRTSMALKNT